MTAIEGGDSAQFLCAAIHFQQDCCQSATCSLVPAHCHIGWLEGPFRGAQGGCDCTHTLLSPFVSPPVISTSCSNHHICLRHNGNNGDKKQGAGECTTPGGGRRGGPQNPGTWSTMSVEGRCVCFTWLGRAGSDILGVLPSLAQEGVSYGCFVFLFVLLYVFCFFLLFFYININFFGKELTIPPV